MQFHSTAPRGSFKAVARASLWELPWNRAGKLSWKQLCYSVLAQPCVQHSPRCQEPPGSCWAASAPCPDALTGL